VFKFKIEILLSINI